MHERVAQRNLQLPADGRLPGRFPRRHRLLFRNRPSHSGRQRQHHHHQRLQRGRRRTTESGSGTYTINSDCSGTYQVTIPGATGPFSYAIALGAGNNLLFLETDAGNAIAGAGQRPSIGSVLPQFVFGAGTWYSALYFTNSNTTSVSFPVNPTADGGTPLTVPSLSGSSVAVTNAPNGTAVLEAPNSGAFGEGYAAVALPAGVTGYGIFRQTVAGRADQEAVVPLASATSTTNRLAWDETGGAVTSLAITNPSAVDDERSRSPFGISLETCSAPRHPLLWGRTARSKERSTLFPA